MVTSARFHPLFVQLDAVSIVFAKVTAVAAFMIYANAYDRAVQLSTG